MDVGSILVLIIMLAIVGCLLRAVHIKKNKVTSVQGHDYPETYCIFTLRILQVAQLLLFLLGFNYMKNIFFFSLGMRRFDDADERSIFSKMYYTEAEFHCLPCDGTFSSMYTWVHAASVFLECCMDFMASLIYMYQAFEWVSMLFLVSYQKDRNTDQVLFEQQHEDVGRGLTLK